MSNKTKLLRFLKMMYFWEVIFLKVYIYCKLETYLFLTLSLLLIVMPVFYHFVKHRPENKVLNLSLQNEIDVLAYFTLTCCIQFHRISRQSIRMPYVFEKWSINVRKLVSIKKCRPTFLTPPNTLTKSTQGYRCARSREVTSLRCLVHERLTSLF